MDQKRVSTGIPDLDRLLGAGFSQGKTYLVSGNPGTGKTIFALQFLRQALLEGEKGLYVAIDEKPADLLAQAESLGWELAYHVEQKSLLILDASALIASRLNDVAAKNDIQKIIVELNNHIVKSGAARVVIDPVGPLIHASDSPTRVHDYARLLIASLQKHFGTTTLVTSPSPGPNLHAIEEYLVSGTIVLDLQIDEGKFLRTMTIEKMRNTALDPKRHSFRITSQKGIILESSDDLLP